MISTKEVKIIRQIAGKYKAKRVYLFGSHIKKIQRKPRDIDLAVEGVAPRCFFSFYAELYDRLPQPVDLIDLKQNNLFSRLIREEGFLIYGRS